MRRLSTISLLCLLCAGVAWAQPWTEPPISPVAMTEPLAFDPPPITGSTFYVDCARGDNANAGTISAPWKTIQYAANQLTAGQGVLVRGGVCQEGNILPANSGTADNYITFRAYPGEHVRVDASGNPFGFYTGAGATQSRIYIVVDGFDIFGMSQQGLLVDGLEPRQNVWFINNRVHGNTGDVNLIQAANNATRIMVSNNITYNSTSSGIGFNDRGDNNIIEFNTVFHTNSEGDDGGAIAIFGSHSTIARYNHVFRNNRNPESCTACFTGNYAQCQGVTGIYYDTNREIPDGGIGSHIYNNWVHGNDAGIYVWQTDNISIFNNVSFNNGTFSAGTFSGCSDTPRIFYPYIGAHGNGIKIHGAAQRQGHAAYNNIAVGNAKVGLWFGRQDNFVARNNVMAFNRQYALNAEEIAASASDWLNHNLYFGPIVPLIRYQFATYDTLAAFRVAQPALEVNGVEGDPLFLDPSNLLRGYQPTSPTTDAGTTTPHAFDYNNVTRPVGAQWDIGAIEATPAVVGGIAGATKIP